MKNKNKIITIIIVFFISLGITLSSFENTAYAVRGGSTSSSSHSSTSSKSSSSTSKTKSSSAPTSGYKSGSFSSSKNSTSTTSNSSKSTTSSSSTSKSSSAPTSGYKSGSFSSSTKPNTDTSSSDKSTTSSSTSTNSSTSTSDYKSGNFSSSNGSNSSDTDKTTSTKPNVDTSSSDKNTTNNSSKGSTFVFIPHSTVSYDNNGVRHYSYSNSSAFLYVLAIIVILIIILSIIYFAKKIKITNITNISKDKVREDKVNEDKFLELELNESKKLYSEIIYSLDEIGDFVSEADLKKRRYVKCLPTVKTYVDMVEKAIAESENKNTFSKLFKTNNKSIELIENFKQENQKAFNETKNCIKCKCFKCSKVCKMEGCNRCEEGKGCRIASCDNETNAVYVFRNKKISLVNNKTGEEDMYNVLGVVQDLEAKKYNSDLPDYGQLYIIIELNGERFTLYFYPGISDDEYGEIESVEDFNFATEAFKNTEN